MPKCVDMLHDHDKMNAGCNYVNKELLSFVYMA